jgi:single-strand DNA-binding protein
MAGLCKATIIGNLGGDPEMRYTPNGRAFTTFNVACNRTYNTPEGERREETEWFQVVTWDRLAETCAQYLTKGRQVYVEGRMQTRSWDGTDGVKHYRTELIAQEVKFLGQRGDAAGGGGGFSPGMAVGADSEGDIDPDELPF